MRDVSKVLARGGCLQQLYVIDRDVSGAFVHCSCIAIVQNAFMLLRPLPRNARRIACCVMQVHSFVGASV